MAENVTDIEMTQRIALIAHRVPESNNHFRERNEFCLALENKKMETAVSVRKHRLTVPCMSGFPEGTPAGARAGARACDAHGYAGACGEGAAKVRAGEVGNDD